MAVKRKNMLWLQSGGCGGCTLSLIGAEGPDFSSSLESSGIDILLHPTLSEESGSEVIAKLKALMDGEFALDILCLEGAVMAGPNGTGRFHMMTGFDDAPMMQIIAELATLSDYVVAVGSCAAYGGVTAGGLNVTEAQGLAFDADMPGGLLGADFTSKNGLPVINISGCPIHPDWVLETLYQIAADEMTTDDLDQFNRPKALSNKLVHHGCSRNEFYEYKASGEQLGHLGCMMEHLGCKGTQASGDCNTRPWNGAGSCISGGYPCIACTEPGFEEPGHTFVETPKIAGIPTGIPTDMPKAWFVALASLSKAATPDRLRRNAVADHISVSPKSKSKGGRS
ncbi:MAG: HupU protein [Rhodospirillales bacterium]|nr:HupU protein [Rhodospirillales bacterium]